MAVSQPSRIDMGSRPSGSKPISRRITSPITPATTAGVTGIVFPFPPETSTSESPSIVRPRPLRRVSRIDTPTSKRDLIEISSNVSVEDAAALDDLWNSLRAQKELKMAKEHPKVKSLEEHKPTLVLNTVPKSSPSPRPPSRITIRLACTDIPVSDPLLMGRDTATLRGQSRNHLLLPLHQVHEPATDDHY
jgi:hypothetical protein